MQNLQRVTIEFVQTEDRFRMTGADENDRTLLLWFTQRLLILVVTHCSDWLVKTSTKPSVPPETSERTRKEIQAFAQESAKQEIKQEKAVAAEPESKSFLVEEVDLKFGEEGIILTFKANKLALARLAFNDKSMRQWLSIIHGLWEKADWPMTIWPEWIDKKSLGNFDTDQSLH